MALGPGSIPPQGARAFVRELLRGGTAGMSVSAIVDETSGASELEFTNDGGETAVALRYIVALRDGELSGGSVGNVPPGASVTAPLSTALAEGDVKCIWMCSDARARLHVWSYDGRHKRVKQPGADEDYFHLFYG